MAKHTFPIIVPEGDKQEKELMDFQEKLATYGNVNIGKPKRGIMTVDISIPDEDEANYNMEEFWTFTKSLYKN